MWKHFKVGAFLRWPSRFDCLQLFDPKSRPVKMIRGWDWWLPASLSRLSHETSGVRHQIHSPQSSQMGSTQSSCKKTGFPTKWIWPSSQIPPFLGRRTIMVVTRLVETGPRPNNTTTVDFEANAFRPIKKGLNHPKTSLLAIKCPNLAPPTHP